MPDTLRLNCKTFFWSSPLFCGIYIDWRSPFFISLPTVYIWQENTAKIPKMPDPPRNVNLVLPIPLLNFAITTSNLENCKSWESPEVCNVWCCYVWIRSMHLAPPPLSHKTTLLQKCKRNKNWVQLGKCHATESASINHYNDLQ